VNKENIIVFGTGSGAIDFRARIKKTHNIVAFIDNDSEKQGKSLFGSPIYGPSEIGKISCSVIVVASDYFDDIYIQLSNNVMFKDKELLFFREFGHKPKTILNRVKSFLKETFFDVICRINHRYTFAIRFILRFFSLNLVKIKNLDLQRENEVCILAEEKHVVCEGPKFIGAEQQCIEIKIPSISLYEFYYCQISVISRAFILNDNSIVIEKIHTVSEKFSKYDKGSLIHHYQNNLGVVKKNHGCQIIENGILINANNENNYYHWMLDIIPQFQYLDSLPEKYKDYSVFISDRAKDIKSVSDMLKLLAVKRKIKFISSKRYYIFKSLLVINSPNRIHPNMIGSAWLDADCSYFRPNSIHFVRHLVLKSFPKSPKKNFKRIFLAPLMKHRKYNRDEVLSVLDKYDFTVVNPEKMGLVEQAEIFNNADVIIGPTGATWANLIFAKPGAKALCWMAEEWGNFSAFSNIATMVDVELDYLTYAAGVNGHIELFSQEYVVNQQKIEDWVRQLTDE
jgi:hypothetical protein